MVHDTLSLHWLYYIMSHIWSGCVLIWPVHFICGTHNPWRDDVSRTIFRSKVKGQGHTGRSKFLPCPLCGSVPIWPIHFICGTHTPWRDDVSWRCVAHHFRVKRSRSHGSFKAFAMSALWLHPYLTDSLHMWYTHNPLAPLTSSHFDWVMP